ncbi:acyltransferase family protein [Chryseobacterium indologenes]|uniref:acyltransferase family protein n=1 Tax=Chryseobacterium indologenes TaxID=253 RepID=UPI00162ACAE7|nr:acyltransferase [Chryseobacterium indologenes]
MRKFDYLDAIRGFAIIGVMMVHSNQHGLPIEGNFKSIVNNGSFGVQLFFVASAFTLFLSHESRKEENNSTVNFFFRRFFRIAPMFYLGIIYYLWQDGFGPRYFLGDQKSITFENVLSTVTFTNSFNPYWINSIVPGGWSIAIEFLFYGSLPFLLFKVIKNLNSAFLFFIASILFSLCCNYYLSYHQLIPESTLWKDYLYLYFPSQLPVFIIGIITYYIVIKEESLKDINSNSLLLLCLMVLIQYSTSIIFFKQHIMISIGFGLLIYVLSKNNYKIIVNSFTKFIGKISFSLYLSHFAILFWMEKFNLVDFLPERLFVNYGIRLLITFILSIPVAYLCYNFIEKPFIKLGSQIIHWHNLERDRRIRQ